jgi:putative membrane protein
LGTILLDWLVSALAIWVVALLGLGIETKGFGTAVIAAAVLGLVDAILRPILTVLALPLIVVTLGLFWFVLNGVMLLLVGALVPGFKVKGVVGAVIAALLIGFASSIIRYVLVNVVHV